MNPNIGDSLKQSKSVLIMLPRSPYFDQVAAATALYLTLKKTHEVAVVSSTPMLVEFNRLVGVDKVVTEIGNKNVLIKLTNYPANQIERVLYDTDGIELTLTVIPLPGVLPPKSENFTFGYTGVSADTVVLIGGANDSHFPELNHKDIQSAKLLHIGRETLVLQNKIAISFARQASSISELTATLLKESGIEIEPEAATNLLMGITEGSRNFMGENVTSHTFRQVAELLDLGGKRDSLPEAPKQPFNPFTPKVDTSAQSQSAEPAPKSWLEPKIYKGTTVS